MAQTIMNDKKCHINTEVDRAYYLAVPCGFVRFAKPLPA